MKRSTHLLESIKARKIRSAVIGAGYVGLSLAVEFAAAGYDVTIIDFDQSKVRRVNREKVTSKTFQVRHCSGPSKPGTFTRPTFTRPLKRWIRSTFAYPPPLRKTKNPDLSCIVDATERIRDHLHPGMLVILESTTYPGTTDEIVLPILEETGLRVGRDFHLVFSPEAG